jgi:hypothetical protein
MAIKVKGCTVVDDIRNITAGVSTVTTGCVTGTFTGSTICATTGFSGSGANITGIPASNITGLSGGGGFCVYTSPGTFSVPPGTTSLKITAIGGGGSTPAGSASPTQCVFIGGGGAGSASVKYLSVPPSCSSYPVTIGGAAGDTIFGGPTVFLTHGGCNGTCVAASGPATGNGGQGGGLPGCCGTLAPATATYGIFSYLGAPNGALSVGEYGRGANTNDSGAGRGAASAFGFGGAGRVSPDGGGAPACGYGAGGGGSRITCGQVPVSGATGTPGFMIVEW